MQLRLTIDSEVTCKFDGLDAVTRKELAAKFKYQIPGAKYMPLVKLGRWDGCKDFFTIGGFTYLNILPEVLEYLEERKHIDLSSIELIDKRSHSSFDFKLIDENYLQKYVWGEDHNNAGNPITLRDYQVSAINDFTQNTQSVQILATGAGKTIISATLAEMVDQYGRSMIIVPSKDLVKQTERYYKYLSLDVGIFYGMEKNITNRHLICTWQSLNSAVKNNPETIETVLDGMTCLMVDECFSPDTKVLTPNGNVPIASLKSGDSVINFNCLSGMYKVDTVVKVHVNLRKTEQEQMLKLVFENGEGIEEEIKVTENHEFLLQNGNWIKAKDLTSDHLLKNIHSPSLFSLRRLKLKTHIKKTLEVYNLHIKNNHNYIIDGGYVVKNCHTAKATVLLDLLTKTFGKIPIRWGFTGTIPKDKFASESIRCSIGEVVGSIAASELQDKNVLSNCHIHVKQLIDYREHKTWPVEIEYLIENKQRLTYIASMIANIASSGNTLVLVDRIGAGTLLSSLIENSVFLNGDTKSSVRKEHYDEVAERDDKILICTYGIAAVGIDIPDIYNLVLLEPGKSFVRVIQSIGRGLRRGKVKDFVDIYDITSTCKFAKKQLTERKKYYKEANYPFDIQKIDWEK